jgi:glycerate dehydrogenase
MKIVILDGYTTNPGDLEWSEIEKHGSLNVYDWTEREDVPKRLKGAEIAITNKVEMDAELMDQLPDLKYIGIMSTGMDHVDRKAAAERGIVVTNVPVYADYSVPQLVFALLLELCYRIDLHHQSVVEEKKWSNQKYNSYWLKPLIGLHGKTIGIIGMGKIGEQVAKIANSFGMKIIAYDVYQREIPNVKWVDLDNLLKESDVISIHCPLLPSTEGMINKDALKKMKKSAFFINTSRGPLMVDKDLADALNDGVIAGAGLDVLNQEPPTLDNPLFDAKNVIITPHIGWATVDARERLINEVALNIEAFIKNEKRNVVN